MPRVKGKSKTALLKQNRAQLRYIYWLEHNLGYDFPSNAINQMIVDGMNKGINWAEIGGAMRFMEYIQKQVKSNANQPWLKELEKEAGFKWGLSNYAMHFSFPPNKNRAILQEEED